MKPRPVRGAGLFVRFVYWMVRRRLGRVPVPLGIMAYHRGVLAAVGLFELAFERATEVDARVKELAVLKTATLVGCRFCIDIGASLARAHGVREEELRELVRHGSSTHFSSLEKNVLDYAVAMTDSPMIVPRPLYDELERALGAPALVELTTAIAWENFRARFNHAFGAKEEGFSERSLCLLPPQATPTQLDHRKEQSANGH